MSIHCIPSRTLRRNRPIGRRWQGGLAAFTVIFLNASAWAGESADTAAALQMRGPQPLMMAGQDHRVSVLLDKPEPNPSVGSAIATARKRLEEASAVPPSPTGLGRGDYLPLVNGVVDYFRRFQDPDGRVIDPFLGREYQYSTPAFALAAASLVQGGKRPDLVDSASRALDSALFQLASGTATDRHGDFFITPTMLAFLSLREHVSEEVRKRWERYLSMIRPELAYSDLIGPGQPDVINWNTSALLGEYLRHRSGFANDDFVKRYTKAQWDRLTPDGLYLDPGAPLAYDASARLNFSLLLEAGYRDARAVELAARMERAAWVSLLMQSPSGDFPAGGRSSEHVWNDALQCAFFEVWAHRSRVRNDPVAMKAFKRAAHLSLQSVSRWVRPSGEFWIVKNHFDPALRHGFETYSSHSQYNLLAAAYLAIAWAHADDTIEEGAAPADVGGFVMSLPWFNKVFAGIGGHYLEIETGADPNNGSTGLLRLHRRGMANALGPGVNAPAASAPLTVGVEWQVGDQWQSLAELTNSDVRVRLAEIDIQPDSVSFDVAYSLRGARISGLIERYVLRPDGVHVAVRFESEVNRWRVRFPAFVFDGLEATRIDVAANAAGVSLKGSSQHFKVTSPPGVALRRSGNLIQTRSGYYQVVEGEGGGDHLAYSLVP